jgi:D-glycero-beta-D-manno-heptose 1-phosphate adenylyltransferase
MNPVEKIKSFSELAPVVRDAQSKGLKVVFANGCFDLLHVGHIRYLDGARACGDILVVGINSDASVRGLKGEGRPLMSESERAEMIASLESVDYVTLFDSPTVDPLLSELRPDVHAKGTDYTKDSVPERATVRSYGGDVQIVGDPKDHSTRDLIRSILQKFGQ